MWGGRCHPETDRPRTRGALGQCSTSLVEERCDFPSSFCHSVPRAIRRWFSPRHNLEHPHTSSKLHWLVMALRGHYAGRVHWSTTSVFQPPSSSICLQHPHTWDVWEGLAKSQLSQLCVTPGFLHTRRAPAAHLRLA